MIPPPTSKDDADVHRRYADIAAGRSDGICGDRYYGYEPDLYLTVCRNFQRFGLEPSSHRVKLIKGLFEDTLHLNEPVAFAHMDGDWYKSTMICLERITPFLIPGGKLIVDDYGQWSGCTRAVDEYFKDKKRQFQFSKMARLHIERIG